MSNISINFVTVKQNRLDKILFVFWNDYFYNSKKYSNDFNYANDFMLMTQMLSNSMLYHNYDRILCYNLEEALELGRAAGFKHAVIQTPGSVINKNFDKIILDYVKSKDYFLIGHILDGKPKNKYLYIHEQLFVINLEKILNFDYIIDKECKTERTFNNYIRSEYNFHDDYTPLWIKKTNGSITTKNYNWSASYLSYGLEVDGLFTFSHNIRSSKLHMYPENKNHKETWYSEINENNQLKNIIDNAYKVDRTNHIFNNENFSKISAKAVSSKIDTLVLPASGFYSVHAFSHFRPTKIIYYDIDNVTLKARKLINETWNGVDNIDFGDLSVNIFQDKNVNNIQLVDNEWIKTREEALEIWKDFQKVDKVYHNIDIIEDYDKLLGILPDNNMFIWLNSIYTYSTNIWNHRPSKIFKSYFSLVYRLIDFKSQIWIDVKEPMGQYRCFEVHKYSPDAVAMSYANYKKFI
jgi:hypothetical protein